MGEFSLSHILIVGIIFLVFFGPQRLPQLGKSLGEGIREFKKGIAQGAHEEISVQEKLAPPVSVLAQNNDQSKQTSESQKS